MITSDSISIIPKTVTRSPVLGSEYFETPRMVSTGCAQTTTRTGSGGRLPYFGKRPHGQQLRHPVPISA